MGLNKMVLAPNVLGEAFLYLSFTVLSNSWVTMILLLTMWVALFYPINVMKNQTVKETLQDYEMMKRRGLYFFNSGWNDEFLASPASDDSDTDSSKDLDERDEEVICVESKYEENDGQSSLSLTKPALSDVAPLVTREHSGVSP